MLKNNERKIRVEYIWLDGGTPQKIRSKTKVMTTTTDDLMTIELSDWNYDGSSTKQAVTNNSEVVIKPKTRFKDPFGGDLLVMCDTYSPDGTPLGDNKRYELEKIIDMDQETWYGFEQEYTMMNPTSGKPLGFPNTEGYFPEPQGNYYCGVGYNHVKNGREIAMEHLDKCIEAGINISGVNAEVMLGQWEYQVGPVPALEGADSMWMSRYILYRIGEKYSVEMNIEPKPVKGDNWNGSGMHVNFSTGAMRDKKNIESGESIKIIERACEKLSTKHSEHISVYGEGNEERLTGINETSSYKDFSWAYGSREVSIRIPTAVKERKVGYLEDRRPSSNGDPYLICRKLIQTICSEEEAYA